MSKKTIIETLMGIGLTETDAEVYIAIAKKGPMPARDIMNSLKINKAQVYRSIKNLQGKGIVESTLETPQNFTAMPFEKVFDLYVKIKNQEVQRIISTREEALKHWNLMAMTKQQELPDRFMVLEGKQFIYTKLQEMINKAENEVLVATNSTSLIEADLDNALEKIVENRKVPIKIISEISTSNYEYISELIGQIKKNIQGKHIDLNGKLFPRFILTDENQLLILTAGFENSIENRPDSALWTNNKSLIQSFKVLFNKLWQDGIDFRERISQLEKGQEPQTNQVIKDPKEAFKMVWSIIASAKKEIIVIITETDLKYAASKLEIFEDLKKRQLDIKILAPITENNRQHVKALSKYVEVRHTQASYFRSAIIDGKHLIQLKTTKEPFDKTSLDIIFASTLYTDIPEFVTGRRDLLLALWEHSPEEIEKMKQSEARFRSIYENSNDAIILAHPDGQVISANNAACKLFNMTIEEMKKTNRENMLVHDHKTTKAIKARETSGIATAELTFKRKDGSTFEAEATSSDFTDVDGKNKHCIIINDITERIQCENALKQSQDRFNSMFNLLSLGISIVDASGKITYTNPAIQQIMGYSKEELGSKSFIEITHPEDRAKMKEAFKDLLECKTDRVTIEKRNVTKDDKIIKVRLNASVLSRDTQGKPLEYITTIEDISGQLDDIEAKRTQELLKESQERFQTVLNNSTDLIYRQNLQTKRFDFVNSASRQILGYEPMEVLNMSNEEVLATVHPDDLPQVQLDMMRIFKEGKGCSEYRIKRKDGCYIWYRNTMFLTNDAQGRPLYRDGFGRDITEVKKAQEILKTKNAKDNK